MFRNEPACGSQTITPEILQPSSATAGTRSGASLFWSPVPGQSATVGNQELVGLCSWWYNKLMVFEGYTLLLRLKALQSTSNSHFVGLRYWKGSHSRSTVMNHMLFFLGLFCKDIKEIIQWLLEINWKNWMICQLEVQSEVDKLIVFARQVSKGYRHYHSWNPPARSHIGVLHPIQQQLHPEAKMVSGNSTDSLEFREPMGPNVDETIFPIYNQFKFQIEMIPFTVLDQLRHVFKGCFPYFLE